MNSRSTPNRCWNSSRLSHSGQPRPTKKPGRTKTSLLYLGFSYLNVAVVMIQGIVLVPLYLRYIDEGTYGTWLATGGALSYLSLLDLGITAVIRQQVAEAYGHERSDRIATIVGTGFMVTAALAVFVMAFGILLAFYLPQWLRVYAEDGLLLRNAIVIAAVANGLTLFAYSVSDVAIALQRVVGVSVINLVAWSCGIGASVIGLVICQWGLLSIPVGALVRALVYLAGLFVNLTLIWSRYVYLKPRYSGSQLRDLLKPVSYVFLGRAAETVISRSDELIVARMLGTEQVAVYALTGRARDAIRGIPDRIGFTVVPALANLYGEQGLKATSDRASQIFSVTYGIAVACASIVLAFNESFIVLWVGSEFYGGTVLTSIICLYFVLLTTRRLLSRLLFAIGEVQRPNLSLLLEAALRIPLAVFFTRRLGLVGLPLGASLALLLANGVPLAHLYVKRMQLGWTEIYHSLPSQAVYTIQTFGIAFLISQSFHPRNWFEMLISVALFSVVLTVVLYICNAHLRKIVAGFPTQLIRGKLGQRVRRFMSSH